MSFLSRIMARKAPRPAAGEPVSGSSPTATAQGTGPAGAAHTVASFDTDLVTLANMVEDMGLRAGRALNDAARALADRSVPLAQQVIASDRSLDLLQHEIEEMAVATLAKRQPLAVDLREVVSAMRVAGDLERIGDLAKNVSKRVIAIGDHATPVDLASGLGALADRVGRQLSEVLKAYAARDNAAALAVWRSDGEIDALFTSLFRELLTYMMEDPRSIGFCTHLLFCAKNLERVGDHATNIAETAHYVITGEALVAERPKGDESIAIASLHPAPAGEG